MIARETLIEEGAQLHQLLTEIIGLIGAGFAVAHQRHGLNLRAARRAAKTQIDAIRKQDGRWVVVTSRGLIVGR